MDEIERRLRSVETRAPAPLVTPPGMAPSLEALERRIRALEDRPAAETAVGGQGGFDKNGKSYLPLKSQIPKQLVDKVEEWRAWKESS